MGRNARWAIALPPYRGALAGGNTSFLYQKCKKNSHPWRKYPHKNIPTSSTHPRIKIYHPLFITTSSRRIFYLFYYSIFIYLPTYLSFCIYTLLHSYRNTRAGAIYIFCHQNNPKTYPYYSKNPQYIFRELLPRHGASPSSCKHPTHRTRYIPGIFLYYLPPIGESISEGYYYIFATKIIQKNIPTPVLSIPSWTIPIGSSTQGRYGALFFPKYRKKIVPSH